MNTVLSIDGEALPDIVRRRTVTVRTGSVITDLGRAYLYEKMADGTLESTTVGGKRLIYLDSLYAMIGLNPDGSRMPGAGTYVPTRRLGRMLAPEPVAEAPPKRKRGRPRKQPVPAEI